MGARQQHPERGEQLGAAGILQRAAGTPARGVPGKCRRCSEKSSVFQKADERGGKPRAALKTSQGTEVREEMRAWLRRGGCKGEEDEGGSFSQLRMDKQITTAPREPPGGHEALAVPQSHLESPREDVAAQNQALNTQNHHKVLRVPLQQLFSFHGGNLFHS